MWDVENYKAAITATKKNGILMDDKVKTKENVYELLAEKIHCSKDTVKSWSRSSNNGPNDNDMIVSLEKVLGIPEGLLGRREEKKMEKDDKMKKEEQEVRLTDFNKQAIHSCYMLMKDYIHSDEVENEDCFAKMCAEVDKYRIAIPQEIYEEINQCIDAFLAPIVYEYHDTFAQCFTDDIGYFDNDGVWNIKDEEAGRKSCMYFLMKLVEIEKSVDNFAMEKLYPRLMM